MLKLKLQYLGPLMWRANSSKKDPDAGTDWAQEEKRATEDEIVGWHHRLSEYEFKHTLGDGERQGSLACCSPWGHKESDMTEQLNSHHLTANTEGWGRGSGRKVRVRSSCDSLHNWFWPWNGWANLFPQSYLPFLNLTQLLRFSSNTFFCLTPKQVTLSLQSNGAHPYHLTYGQIVNDFTYKKVS